MLDTYTPEPFDGVERLKRFCKTVDEPKVPLPRYSVETVIPRSGLFDIIKRYSNKPYYDKKDIVAVGFTYAEALEFRKKRLKTKDDKYETVAVYYDIVEQGNAEALNPLWNPKEITKEGGTDTSDMYAN